MLRSKGVTWAAEGSGAGAAQAEDDDDPNDNSEDAVEQRKEKLRVTLGEQPPQNWFHSRFFSLFPAAAASHIPLCTWSECCGCNLHNRHSRRANTRPTYYKPTTPALKVHIGPKPSETLPQVFRAHMHETQNTLACLKTSYNLPFCPYLPRAMPQLRRSSRTTATRSGRTLPRRSGK